MSWEWVAAVFLLISSCLFCLFCHFCLTLLFHRLLAFSCCQKGDVGIYVTNIIPGGSAHEDNRLRIGDRILSVNSATMNSITHAEAVTILQVTPPSPPSPPSPTPP